MMLRREDCGNMLDTIGTLDGILGSHIGLDVWCFVFSRPSCASFPVWGARRLNVSQH